MSYKLNSKLLSKILFILIIILVILLGISYTKAGIKASDKRKPVKTALYNKKNIDNITNIQISKGNESISISKLNDFWTIEPFNNDKNQNYSSIPADTSKINAFINDLSQIRQLYKVSDKPGKDNKFGFMSEESYNLRITLKDGTFTELVFGNKDFSLTARYLMTAKSLTVYQINDFNEAYLSTNIQSWSDPYIISKAIIPDLSADKIQTVKVYTENSEIKTNPSSDNFTSMVSKLIDLRHGGSGSNTEISKFDKEMKIILELGNKDSVILEIYPSETAEREYNVKTTYNLSLQNKEYVYSTKISLWTYNKIKEIML